MFNKINLFPTTVGTYVVNEDISPLLEYLQTTNYSKVDNIYPQMCSSTNSINILNRFGSYKLLFLHYFTVFKNSIFNYNSTNFEITTSWGTRTKHNEYSNFHVHKNSFFSGVFYFQTSEQGGFLELIDNIRPSSYFIKSNVNNIETGDIFAIKPQKNLLIFFPSYLRHRISVNLDKETRYSLAFNVVPVGYYGLGDSSLNVIIDM